MCLWWSHYRMFRSYIFAICNTQQLSNQETNHSNKFIHSFYFSQNTYNIGFDFLSHFCSKVIFTCTVADYRPSTVRLQVKTLLPCTYTAFEITGNIPVKVLKSVISIVDYLYFRGEIHGNKVFTCNRTVVCL